MARIAKTLTLAALYRAWKAAETAWKAAQADAVAGKAHGDSVPMGDGARGTVVIGTSRTADVVKAREVLKPAQFKAITETKVSLTLLDAMVKAGKITQAESEMIAPTRKNAPFVKVTLS